MIELVTPPAPSGPVAPLIEEARALVLADKPTFDKKIAEIQARIDEEITPFVNSSVALQVTDAEGFEKIQVVGKRAAQFIARIEELIKPLSEDFWRPFKRTKDLQNIFVEPLTRVKEHAAEQIRTWNRKERERVAREEAAARARQAAAEEAARAQRQEVAKDLVEAGNVEAAQELLTRPVEVPSTPVPVPVQAPRVEGVVDKAHWKWRLSGETQEEKAASFRKLVAAVAEGVVPLEALTTNDKWLNKVSGAMRSALRWPGIVNEDVGQVAFGRK